MQSTPTLKDTDPHDVFAIESLLHAHAEKAPPLAHDPAVPPAAPQVHVVPPISVDAPTSQVEPTFRAPDMRDIPVESIGLSEIKVDGLKPIGERPTPKWLKRVVMALLGLCGVMAAAAWQHYGDQAKAVATEWAPPFVLAALSTSDTPAVAEQPNAPADQAAAVDPAAAQPAAATTAPVQPEPAATAAAAPAATAPSSEPGQLQSMAQDLATMGQQVEELKTTIAQLKASQAQMAREHAKASEAKAAETKPAEQNLRPRVSALTPPAPKPAAPARKPKPAYSRSPAYSPAPVAAAPAAPLPPAQAAAPLPPPAPQQTIADDGQPVVRPPMPLR
jgi:hypothetical protein